MFSSVSWSQYITILLVATIIYYLFIWIVIFKAKLPGLAGVSNLRPVSLYGEDQPDEMITTAQHVMDEIRHLFSNVGNKNELILALQLRLQKYSLWEEPGFRETINRFVVSECQSKCSIRLEAEDLRALWE